MKLALRRNQPEDDYHRIGDFVGQLFLLSQRRMLSWQVARLDYWR